MRKQKKHPGEPGLSSRAGDRVGVYIGRFQPFHNGHQETLVRALAHYSRILVLVGSADAQGTLRNPFAYGRRIAMIRPLFPKSRLVFLPLADSDYEVEDWARRAHALVETALRPGEIPVLLGHDKDSSTWYLGRFPHWEARLEGLLADGVSATLVRRLWLDSAWRELGALVPGRTYWSLRLGALWGWDRRLRRDLNLARKAGVSGASIRLMVFQGEKVLLQRRSTPPARGTWQLPGGCGIQEAGQTLSTLLAWCDSGLALLGEAVVRQVSAGNLGEADLDSLHLLGLPRALAVSIFSGDAWGRCRVLVLALDLDQLASGVSGPDAACGGGGVDQPLPRVAGGSLAWHCFQGTKALSNWYGDHGRMVRNLLGQRSASGGEG